MCARWPSEEGRKAKDLLREWYSENQYNVLEDVVRRRAAKPKDEKKGSKKIRLFKLWIKSKR